MAPTVIDESSLQYQNHVASVTVSLHAAISVENVRFDTQKMENPEISGVEYQQGELHGYEVREYLLEKFNRTCVYCGVRDVPMEVEHIVPKTRGGSNRVSNLTLSCQPCNQKKSDQTVAEFGYPEVEKQAKAPLKDAAAAMQHHGEFGVVLKQLGCLSR